MITIDGRVSIFGGTPHTNVVEEFLPHDKVWKTLDKKLLKPRSFSGVATLPEKLFINTVGGCNGKLFKIFFPVICI